MKRLAQDILLVAVLIATSLVVFAPSAEAVPSYTRRYGFDCSSCHTVWGALNAAGVTFRLSGYRAMFGKDLVPIEENHDINIPGTSVRIPSTLPLSFVTGVGYDYRNEKRTGFDGTTNTRVGSSGALEDASIFLTSPIGDRFAAFVEFPMYETKSWEFTPTGPSAAAAEGTGGANDLRPLRHFQFATEKPTFEVAKFWWNNLLGDLTPRDSVNGLVGITHLPLAYASGKVRLSVNQYLIYERRAFDLISPVHTSFMGGADELFRLGEPQFIAELNGMVVPGGNVTDSAKRETLWFEYHAGATNASNDAADNNRSKGGYGRLVARWYGQSLGGFGFYTPDIYGDALRVDTAFQYLGGCPGACTGGIYNAAAPYTANSSKVWGVDGTLSLMPWGIPLSLANQYMVRQESNPTGFNAAFNWRGGFHQLEWTAAPRFIVYGRYDWIRGDRFNDVPLGGITFSDPREWDIVAGAQYAVYENVKLIGEFRHHQYQDRALGASAALTPFPTRIRNAQLTDDGFTVRLMMGF